MIDKIHETISSLELQSDKKVRHFCIGKTYAEAKSNKTFNLNDVDTWKVRGISDRWNKTSEAYKNRGYDGLVVLGAVSRGMLQKKCNEEVWNQQLYIVALEKALITHFAYEECDRRLANDIRCYQDNSVQRSLSAFYMKSRKNKTNRTR